MPVEAVLDVSLGAAGLAAAAFFGLWFAGRALLHPTGATALHLLFAAYFAHLTFRTVWLSLRYKKEVLVC